MIFVVGYPRSGTNYLNRLLVHYLDDSHPEWNGYGQHSLVSKIHWEYQLERCDNPQIVFIYRDPRSVAISGYFYYLQFCGWKYGHTISNFSLMSFLQTCFTDGFDDRKGWPLGWKQYMDKWLDKGNIQTSYERLIQQREIELGGVILSLGAEYDTIKASSAFRLSELYGAKRVPYVHKPGWELAPKMVSPIIDEWKYHFGTQELEFIYEHCGKLMEQLGYE